MKFDRVVERLVGQAAVEDPAGLGGLGSGDWYSMGGSYNGTGVCMSCVSMAVATWATLDVVK